MLLIDDLLAGLAKATFSRPPQPLFPTLRSHLRHSWLIWTGLFKGSLSIVISRFSWEILQTLTGFLAAHILHLFRPVSGVGFSEGTTVVEGAGIGGSISLGSFILFYPGYKLRRDDLLFMHEFGHSLQSRSSGPLYLFKYGLPSLIMFNDLAWMEQDANFRVHQYFLNKYARQVDKLQFGEFSFSQATAVEPKWWEYILLLSGAGLLLIPLLNLRRPL